MKSLSRDPTATARARKAEAAADAAVGGGFSVKPISLAKSSSATSSTPPGASAPATGSGFKKGGFRSAFKPAFGAGAEEEGGGGGDKMDVDVDVEVPPAGGRKGEGFVERDGGDDWSRWGSYDPKRPTGCGPGCPGAVV